MLTGRQALSTIDGADPDTLTDSGSAALSAAPDLATAHLIVVVECSRPSAGSSLHSLAGVERVAVGRGSSPRAARAFDGARWSLTLSLPDARASTAHAAFVRDGGDWFVEDRGSRNGTRLNGARVTEGEPLVDGDVVEVGHTLLRYRAALRVPLGFPVDWLPHEDEPDALFRTVDPVLARRVARLGQVAASDVPILLQGETGTGKEVLARAIHDRSRRPGELVAVNCAALPASLVEAQLFGHVRGAFSGAVTDAPGLLRTAQRGTVLLDEIGDLPAESQATLLRALQEREVLPVGASRPVKVDFRVIAATNRSLEALVQQGTFRSDLFARLAGFSFTIPPLRERRDDIGLLLQAYARQHDVRLKPAAGAALLGYDWPLNVRELFQVLGVASTFAGDDPIDRVHLPAAIAQARASPAAPTVDPVRERLVAALARHRGNVSEAALELGKARMQVHRWMKRFGIDPRSFRTSLAAPKRRSPGDA